MTFIHLDPSTSTSTSTSTQAPAVGLVTRVRRAVARIRTVSISDDPTGWNPCGCINALRDTCDSPSQRDAQYRAAFRHAVAKP